jgi:hypothetical protein
MGYAYRGDYYRGDYYRGDLWGSITSGFKKIVNVGVDVASGNFGKAIGDAFGSGGTQGGVSEAPKAPGTAVARLGPPGRMPVPAGAAAATDAGGVVLATPGGGMRGYHLNKSNEYCNGTIVTPKHTKWVRNRSMNPTNVRALRRADRRAHSFLRIAKSVTRHYVARQPKGRAYVHARRRRK